MSIRDDVLRATNTVGLATWFGGSLMGAVGLEGAAEQLDDEQTRTKVESAGWSQWSPMQATAIASYLGASAAIAWVNKGRVAGQRGVMTASIVKTALTAGALGATVATRRLGKAVEESTDREAARKKLRAAQWAVPALTGALLVTDAKMGEQQRPSQVAKGIAARLLPDAVADRIAA